LGALTITPATLTVKADDKAPDCFGAPDFSATITGFQYQDVKAGVIASGPDYSLVTNSNQVIVGTPVGGAYSILPLAVNLVQPSNYSVTYSNGTLLQPDSLFINATAIPANLLWRKW
jgi:hypothetical protein